MCGPKKYQPFNYLIYLASSEHSATGLHTSVMFQDIECDSFQKYSKHTNVNGTGFVGFHL
jgi:hypothetical protein